MKISHSILAYGFTALVTMGLTYPAFSADCNQRSSASQLYTLELNQLLLNAPTFKYGVDDGVIQLAFENLSSKDKLCSSQLKLTLPQRDIDDVNAYLDANPARRILIAAQGYSIPESTTSEVEYHFHIATDDNLQAANDNNIPLNNLHHSIEYMYELLAQLRAEVKPGSTNQIKWPESLVSRAMSFCDSKFLSTSSNQLQSCTCRVNELSAKISPRQMELIDYVNNQPFAAANGMLNSYLELSTNINHACGLKNR